MNENWAEKEFAGVDLGDKRLNRRLIQLAENFSKSPEAPINQSCDSWAQAKAAYRFLKNDSVEYKNISKSHVKATRERCVKETTVLAVQDTTFLTYSHHLKTKDLCTLTKHEGKNKKEIVSAGLIMHSTLAVSTDGLPLGLLDQKIYSRKPVTGKKKEIKERSHNCAIPIEEKDSMRWLEPLVKSHELFRGKPVRVVTVADRESDIYDLFRLGDKLESSILVRANHNRTVNKVSRYSESSGEKLWDLMKSKKTQGIIKVKVPEKEKRSMRLAECEIKISEFKCNAPRNHIRHKEQRLPDMKLYAIYVKGKRPSKEIEPISWMLITNIAVNNIEDAIEKIEWYCLRWRIEVFHKILKSGLRVEDCRLSTAQRLIKYLAVMSIVAWRIFWLTLVSRRAPDVPCFLFLQDIEWKILFKKMNPTKKIPKKIPTIKEVTVWIARLGGFLARKSDKDPGITHVWRGLKEFENILEGVKIAKDIYG